MKKLVLFITTLLLARENPFVLPGQKIEIPHKEVVTKKIVHKETEIEPTEKEQQNDVAKQDRLLDLGFLKIAQQEKRLIILTNDPLRGSFMLDHPKKVVFDFKKRRSFKTKSIAAKAPFKKLTIGAHKRFYRIAIEVDPRCHPKVDKKKLTIECR